MPISMDSRNSEVRREKRFEIVAICQVTAIFLVLITCVVNLSLGTDKAELWSSLLAGALGYLLPSPRFKKQKNGSLLPDASQQQFAQLLPGEHVDGLYDAALQSDQPSGLLGVCPSGDQLPAKLVYSST